MHPAVLGRPKDGEMVIEQGGPVDVTDAKVAITAGQSWGSVEVWEATCRKLVQVKVLLILDNATNEHGTEVIVVSKMVVHYNGGIIQATNSKFLIINGQYPFINMTYKQYIFLHKL